MAKKIEVRLDNNPVKTNIYRNIIKFVTVGMQTNPNLATAFNFNVKVDSTIIKNINKTFTASTSDLNNTIRGANVAATIANLVTNLQTYNTDAAIAYSSSGTDLYIDVTTTGEAAGYVVAVSNNTVVISNNFLQTLTQNTTEQFTYNLAIPSEFIDATNYQFQFAAFLTAGKITIGATKAETVINLYNFLFNYYQPYSYVTVITNVDGADILINKSDVTVSTVSVSTNVDLTYVDITPANITRDEIILSRSPYNVFIEPTVLFDSAEIEMRLYRGEFDVDKPNTPQFTLSNQVIKAGQTKINFEVAKFVNDYCKSNIPIFGIGINTSTAFDSVWLETTLTAFYQGSNIGQQVKNFYAVDGFGYHTELMNPKLQTNVLSSITNHIVYRYSDYPIYFVSEGLQSIKIGGVSQPFGLNPEFNNQLVSYINIGSYTEDELLGSPFLVRFTYETGNEDHFITVKDACKYPLYNCFFKNKYGVWQSIPFSLRNKQSFEVESSEYMPIISTFGEYSLQSHQQKTFNPNAKEKITCNTDYLPEYYNLLFDELMVSEFVYLENDGQYLPVNINKKSFERKTRLFDKLIQYTMEFEYSFNKINQVY
ncbi:hypothetical protein UFOVP634_33 [uncultured Caudovirales phage]|uniref:Uncharacterized protein n=1 Tax=uncultured Caudovirales phage TaxID=2100421 RepID=A0A6J5N515_9CAUD|nr:hypothetical protein UFOVP634_33 [uncultured Caudovirales phage]